MTLSQFYSSVFGRTRNSPWQEFTCCLIIATQSILDLRQHFPSRVWQNACCPRQQSIMYIINWEHTWTWNVKTWSELAMSSSTRCTAITGRIADSWSCPWSPVTCLTARRPSTPVIKIPVNWWSLLNIQEFYFILHLHTLCIHFLVDLVTFHDFERNIIWDAANYV